MKSNRLNHISMDLKNFIPVESRLVWCIFYLLLWAWVPPYTASGVNNLDINLSESFIKSPPAHILLSPTEKAGVTSIAVGGSHTCAMLPGGALKCWGGNWDGQLGNGTLLDISTPVDVSGLNAGTISITAGGNHTCVLISGGGVKCWGDNSYGQLGDGTTTDQSTPVDVVGLSSGVINISAGSSHTCALVLSGGLKCWGDNYNGQLGDGTTDHSSTPVDVVGLSSGVINITAGGNHTCALVSGGGVKCWGNNSYGQLGDGTTTDQSAPVSVVGLSNGGINITSGGSHTCALVIGGGVKCWGNNWNGQLGNGTQKIRTTPGYVSELTSGVAEVDAGGIHTCALLTDSGLKCWGGNLDGQLGDGTTQDRNTPADVSGMAREASIIEAGGSHTCALVLGGGIKCWGSNYYGQVGDGGMMQRNLPVDVVELASNVTAVAAGDGHTCALFSDGGVKCWGSNGHGQLGNGTTQDSSTPVDVVGLSGGVMHIAAGGSHTCALLSSGGLKCWGNNWNGQLGDGTITDRSTPVDVVGLTQGVAALDMGHSHTCAVMSDGGAKCWGYNYSGELGDGTHINQSIPVDIVGLTSGVADIDIGGGLIERFDYNSHSCALLSGGGAKCWGSNKYGQLGNGTLQSSNVPVDVAGLASGVTTISAGNGHTCALMSGGGVKCWGANGTGQLGNGTTQNSNTPVEVSG